MVDVHVGGHQGPHVVHRKADLQLLRPRPPIRRRLGPLKQTAVDEQAVDVINEQLVTRPRHPIEGAVMDDVGKHE